VTFKQQVLVTLLDRGLLALVIASAGFFSTGYYNIGERVKIWFGSWLLCASKPT
jgi:hypothetical protein